MYILWHALHNYIAQLTIDRNKLLVDPSRCRYTGSNRIISFVLIKQKKIFSHAATEKNPTEKGA